jgi:hypothetical protein
MIFSTAAQGRGALRILGLRSAYEAIAEAVNTYRVRYQKSAFNGTGAGPDRDLRQRRVRQRRETGTEKEEGGVVSISVSVFFLVSVSISVSFLGQGFAMNPRSWYLRSRIRDHERRTGVG